MLCHHRAPNRPRPARKQLTVTTQRPRLLIAEVVDRFEVSRSTLRRGLLQGRFPNATKDTAGRWVIPVDDLFQASIKSRKTWLNESAHQGGHEPGSPPTHEPAPDAHFGTFTNDQAGFTEQAQLRADLAQERAQAEKLQALLDSEREHTASLKMALRLLQAGPTNRTTPAASPQPAPTAPKPAPAHRGLFARLFRHQS